jgi:hypothetical protein
MAKIDSIEHPIHLFTNHRIKYIFTVLETEILERLAHKDLILHKFTNRVVIHWTIVIMTVISRTWISIKSKQTLI